MAKKKIGKLVITIPDPLSIETEGLGRILLSHWTVGAISKTSKIIEKDSLKPDQFVVEFVRELARIPSNDEKLSDQYENGQRILNPETLTNNDREKIAREYINKWKNEILYWVAYEDEDRNNLDLDKNESETDLEYFYRIIKTSVKKSAEQSRKIIDKFNYFGSSKGFLEEITKNQQKLGAISERIKGIQKFAFEVPNLEPLHTRIPELPPNPVHETNQLLNTQLTQLKSLSSLVEAQGEQAVLLNEQTELLLKESAASSAQAKIGVWIAAAGIFIGAILSAYSIFRSINSEMATNKILAELVVMEKKRIDTQRMTASSLDKMNRNLVKTTHENVVTNEHMTQLREQLELIDENNGGRNSDLAHAINSLAEHLKRNSTNE